MFDITTHNGIITILNPVTGDHRTVKVQTQKDDADFMPGKRLLSMLVGPDNTSSYKSFGVLHDDYIQLWRTCDGPIFRWLANFLLDPTKFADKVEVNFEGRCRRCGRQLTTPESVETGIGPICAGKE